MLQGTNTSNSLVQITTLFSLIDSGGNTTLSPRCLLELMPSGWVLQPYTTASRTIHTGSKHITKQGGDPSLSNKINTRF